MEGGLRVFVARSYSARLLGLALLADLEPGQALLIPGCSSVHTFGMRFAIDVAFLRAETVVAVHERLPPFRIVSAPRTARAEIAALELAAGQARRLGIRPGSRLPPARFL